MKFPDPQRFETSQDFKHEVYETQGLGSWLDDMKLEILWRKAHGKELTENMKRLTNNGGEK